MARRRTRSYRTPYKRIPIIPGFLWLNVSWSGISFSLGSSSARVTAGSSGARVSSTIPGTGVRVSKSFGSRTLKGLFGGGKKR